LSRQYAYISVFVNMMTYALRGKCDCNIEMGLCPICSVSAGLSYQVLTVFLCWYGQFL